MTKSLRVLHLIKGLGRGGAERLVVDQVAFGDHDDFAYDVAYLLPWKDALVADAEHAGASVFCLDARVESDLRWAFRLRRLVRDRNVDIVHVHSPYVAGIARLALRAWPRVRNSRIRIVSTLHNRADSHRRSTRWLDARTIRFDDLDFAVSESVLASLPAPVQRRFEVVVHGVDVDGLQRARTERDSVRTELGVAPDDLVVTTVANLRATKDHATLLRAAALALRRAPETRFFFVGQGPLEAEIRAACAAPDLNGRVQMLGQRDDVPRVLAGSDVFALSSRFEGLPVALMEALVVGLPVVATSVGGIPELVDDGREGRLVPPGRPEVLADALAEVATNPDLRRAMSDAAAARGHVLDVRTAVRTIEARYRALAGESR